MKLIYLFSVLGLLYACNTTHKLNDNVIDENIEMRAAQNPVARISPTNKASSSLTESEMRFKLLRKAANL